MKVVLRIPQETENILQEGESDVAIDLGLNGDLDLEVEVQAKLQRFLGGDGSLVGAADELSTSDGGGLSSGVLSSGFGGRHVDAE